MAFNTKMKIKKSDNGHDVLVLVNHPMETGNRTDSKTGEKIPAHYIEKMVFQHNGKEVADCNIGQGISANPLIGVSISNANPGDTVSASWTDNKGESGSAEATVK